MKKAIFYFYGLHYFFAVYILVSVVLLTLNDFSWRGNEVRYIAEGFDYWISFRTIIFLLSLHMFYKLWFIKGQRSKYVDEICKKENIDRKQFFSNSTRSIVAHLKKED